MYWNYRPKVRGFDLLLQSENPSFRRLKITIIAINIDKLLFQEDLIES